MGTNKALLKLAGVPLIGHAVRKLLPICREVSILGSDPEFAEFAPLVPDLHPGCGPIGGIEAALLRSAYEWNVFLAVDMPLLPTAFIRGWMGKWLDGTDDGARIRMFFANDRPQPGFCMLHRDVSPYLFGAIRRGEFRLMQAFRDAGRELEARNGTPAGTGLWSFPVGGEEGEGLPQWIALSEAQRKARPLWFANLNSPEDFVEAEECANALDWQA